MSNYERVLNYIAQLGKVIINSNNNILNNIIINIDTYDIYDDHIVIGSLDDSSFVIYENDVLQVNDNIAFLHDYTMTFQTT